MNKDEIKQVLLDCIYTPDAKPVFLNGNWCGGDVDDKLKRIDEAVDKIHNGFQPSIYEEAGELLSVDEEEGLTLQEMLDAIIAQNKIDGTVMVDSLEGVYMWEKLEWSFSCRNFLKHIGADGV